jgi:hypothetical protein
MDEVARDLRPLHDFFPGWADCLGKFMQMCRDFQLSPRRPIGCPREVLGRPIGFYFDILRIGKKVGRHEVRERIELNLGSSDPATDMLDDFSRFSHAFNLFLRAPTFQPDTEQLIFLGCKPSWRWSQWFNPGLTTHQRWFPPIGDGTHKASPLPDHDLFIVPEEAVLDQVADGPKPIWVFENKVKSAPGLPLEPPVPTDRDCVALGGQHQQGSVVGRPAAQHPLGEVDDVGLRQRVLWLRQQRVPAMAYESSGRASARRSSASTIAVVQRGGSGRDPVPMWRE